MTKGQWALPSRRRVQTREEGRFIGDLRKVLRRVCGRVA